jgi:hypothetical protein
MARPKKQADAAKSEAGTNGQGGVRVNKMELVRKALKKLGGGAKPKRIQGYLQKRYGLEMSNDMVAKYKSSILKKAAGQSRVTPPPEVAPRPAKAKAANGGVRVEDVRAVKELADKIGAEKVRAVMDVLYQ